MKVYCHISLIIRSVKHNHNCNAGSAHAINRLRTEITEKKFEHLPQYNITLELKRHQSDIIWHLSAFCVSTCYNLRRYIISLNLSFFTCLTACSFLVFLKPQTVNLDFWLCLVSFGIFFVLHRFSDVYLSTLCTVKICLSVGVGYACCVRLSCEDFLQWCITSINAEICRRPHCFLHTDQRSSPVFKFKGRVQICRP